MLRACAPQDLPPMQFLSFVTSNALLFMSLVLVVGVPVLFATNPSPYGTAAYRSKNIRWIEIGAGIWFHLLLIQAFIGEFVTHQM